MSLDKIQEYTFLGTKLVNLQDIGSLSVKLVMDIIFTLLIIRVIFYPIYKERDYVFTTILINITVFLVCFLMGCIKLKIGFAFGLFAVFSILRYRTEQIPIREMTYLFIVIIVAVINALSDQTISYAELFLANFTILLTIYIVENNFLHGKEFIQTITYEKIDLIKPENYKLLISDLKERTGFDIKKAEIETINFLNDTAKLKIVYQYPDEYAACRDEKDE